VTLGLAITEALPDLRAQALSLMVDTGRISRATGSVFDIDTGVVTPGAFTTIHEGPCRLRMPTAVETERLFGDTQVTVTRFVAVFPHDVYGVVVDDIVTITVTDDEDAADRQFKVSAGPAGTDLVSKSFGCEAVE
jgi:hypothetical protein